MQEFVSALYLITLDNIVLLLFIVCNALFVFNFITLFIINAFLSSHFCLYWVNYFMYTCACLSYSHFCLHCVNYFMYTCACISYLHFCLHCVNYFMYNCACLSYLHFCLHCVNYFMYTWGGVLSPQTLFQFPPKLCFKSIT